MTDTTHSTLRAHATQLESAPLNPESAWPPGHRDLASADALLSTGELAAYLDVLLKTIYAWRHRRSGPRGFRVGRHLRFRWSDVQDWVVEQLDQKT